MSYLYEDTRYTRWCREYGYDPTTAEAEAAWIEHERERRRFEQIAAGGRDPKRRWQAN